MYEASAIRNIDNGLLLLKQKFHLGRKRQEKIKLISKTISGRDKSMKLSATEAVPDYLSYVILHLLIKRLPDLTGI